MYNTSTIQIPYGSLIEIIASKGVGKTSYTFDLINQIQQIKPSGSVLYIDADKTIYLDYLEKHKIDLNRLLLHEPITLEECFNTTLEFVKSFTNLIVIDKIENLIPKNQLIDKKLEEKKQQYIKRKCEELLSLCKITGTVIIFLNNKEDFITKDYMDISMELLLDKPLKNAYGYKGNRVNTLVHKNLQNVGISNQFKVMFGGSVQV